jgi:protein gp37
MAEISSRLPLLTNVWLGTSVENSDYIDRLDALRCTVAAVRFVSLEPLLGSVKGIDLKEIDWAIVGGESGPGARPVDAAWVREIRDACRRDGTAFFFKQWGGKVKKRHGRTLDGQTWNEFPRSVTPA